MTSIWRRDDERGWRLMAPSDFPDEASLHDLVEEAPHMLPLSGSPRLVILGREVRLGSGYADLIGVEPSGRPTVIEIKLARNAEARRAVVAQVLAYAAYLYGVTVDDLEHDLLVDHLRRRGADTVAGVVAANDQVGSLNSQTFEESLQANLEAGRFRLVFVLDDAPEELVKLVGYLEAVTPELTIDLITVSQYQIDGSAVLVPQRVDPERPAPANWAATSSDEREGYLARGSQDFADRIAASPETAQPQLRMLLDWAISLEEENLIRLDTYHGKGEVLTLLPRLEDERVGLVTVWHDNRGGYVQFWRSVFERRAPAAIERVEEAAAPATVGQGTITREITDDLLAVLTDAYREAVT